MAAGIGDFPGQNSHQVDEFGFSEDNDDEMGGDGYDLNQHGDDDNE